MPLRVLWINSDWCKGCGICIAFCPRKVLGTGPEGKPEVIRPEACTACGLCELRCPDYAIEVLEQGGKNNGQENRLEINAGQ
ncbi:MAG: 2-oxoglutarate ferredoxin oxidoreductase subunit delta [Clostridia bacterium]|nr:2-oxoglutarate ferredoxin oxidoreductase subunit delta [Clostridia bacterium]